MAFDPDAYLSADAPAFDPDAYLKASEKPAPQAKPGVLSRLAHWTGADRTHEALASAVAGAASLGQVLDPVVAAAGALGSYAVPHTAPEGASLGQRFTNEMENLRRTREERYRASPNAFGAGAILEGGAVAPALLKAAPFSRVAPTGSGPAALLQRMGAGAADAATFNAASQAASNIDKDPLGAATEAATSPMNLLGAAPALVEPFAAVGRAALPGTARLLAKPLPKVKPTEAAQMLRKEGVPLTLGQNDPDSFYAALEQASADHPLGMHIEQAQAKDAFGNVVIDRARPPGAEPVTPGSPQERLAATRTAFDEAYGPLSSQAVAPETLAGLSDAALKPRLGVPESRRTLAAKAIKDALSALAEGATAPISEPRPVAITREVAGAAAESDPNGISLGAGEPGISPDGTIRDPQFRRSRVYPGTNRPRPTSETGYRVAIEEPPSRPEVTTGDLHQVRSNMREARRAAVASGDSDMAKALEHGLDTVTGAIESSLTPEQVAQLRATDAQYRKFMTVEDAAAKGGPESNIHPRALASVLPRSAGKAAVVEGRAGELQDLAQAGTRTFDQRVKPTGMRGPILHMIPKPGVVSRALNQPAMKAALLGETLTPPVTPEMGQAASPLAQARALALSRMLEQYGPTLRLRPVGVQPIPTMAEDDRR